MEPVLLQAKVVVKVVVVDLELELVLVVVEHFVFASFQGLQTTLQDHKYLQQTMSVNPHQFLLEHEHRP